MANGRDRGYLETARGGIAVGPWGSAQAGANVGGHGASDVAQGHIQAGRGGERNGKGKMGARAWVPVPQVHHDGASI
jgi:hypothetical protein